MEPKGYIQLYTGNGKGKTTAALGLAIRAAGAGKKVFIAQFVKGMHYSELEALKRFPEIEWKQYGLDCFIINQPLPKDIEAAQQGLEEATKAIFSKNFDIVILDEVCIAIFYKLFELQKLLDVLKNKPEPLEIVMTGRYAPPELMELADLVTEMMEKRHYFNKGVQARKGIEF